MGIETAAIIAATAISTGTAVVSAKQQGDLADYQADQADADARAEVSAGKIAADQHRERVKRLAASARAAGAASGIKVNSDVSTSINKDITRRGEIDALAIQDNSADSASRLRAQADALRIQGSNTRTAGYVGAAGSAISSYGSIGSGWKTAPKQNAGRGG